MAEEAKESIQFGRRAWLAAVTLVLAQAVMFAWNLEREYGHTLDVKYARLADAARIADEHVSGSLRAIDLLLRDVGAELERWGVADPGAMSDYMATRARAFPEVRSVVVTDTRGVIIASTRADFLGRDLHERGYFARVRDAANRDNTVFSPLTFATATNTNVVFATRALPSRDGQWAGVVSASLEIGLFQDLLATIRPDDPSSAALIVGTDGRIISRAPDPEHFAGFDINKGGHFEQHRPCKFFSVNSHKAI